MARWTRLIPAFAVTLVLAACGQGTTDTPLSPPAARLDGGAGVTLGGNYVPPSPNDSTTTTSTTSSNETSLPDPDGRAGTTLAGN